MQNILSVKMLLSRRNVIIGVLLMLLISVGIFYTNKCVLDAGSSYILNTDNVPESQAIVILGAYVFPDGTASQMLEERLKAGYELYKKGKAGKIIVSGDHSRKNYDKLM